MSQSLISPNFAATTADNVLMDIDSDHEAEQEAQDAEIVFRQAQEKLRLVNEAWEQCQVAWKKLEEKEQIVVAMKLVTK